jgi:hypothetical protein
VKLLVPDKTIILVTQICKIMYRYFFRFVVMTLTILIVNLITNAVTNYMVSYRNHYKPVAFTFLGMAITVVILYPLFIKLESWVKIISVKAIRSGKSAGGKFFGLLFSFLVALLILSYFYAKMWYHINLFHTILHGGV